MTPSFSVYLEIIRITATLLVFVAHSSSFYQPLAALNEEAKLGRDGVVIFFVLLFISKMAALNFSALMVGVLVGQLYDARKAKAEAINECNRWLMDESKRRNTEL